jgi:RHS repeat-associated protein
MSISDVSGKTNFLNLKYSRDGDSNLTGDGSQTMGYDQLDRQNSAASGATTYSYDLADNLTQAASGSTTTNVFDAAEQISTSTTMTGSTLVKKLTYTFDSNGSRTQQTDQNNVSTMFGYDQGNRLTRFGSNATYSYNGDGLRTKKTVSGVTEAYVWNLPEASTVPLADGSTYYVTGFRGLPLEQISSKTVYYYHQDQLGSTRAMTDSRGAVAQTYTYDSYGNVTASSGSISNPMQFAGQYADSESGLLYLRNRYYDPSVAVFLTKDPQAPLAGPPYAYAADSPQNLVDPKGTAPINLLAGWNALIAGAASLATPDNISTVAGTISGACGVASLAIVDAPLTGTCALVFGAVALGADLAKPRWDRVAIGLDVFGMIPGGKLVGWGSKTLMAGYRTGKLSAFLHLSTLTATGAGDFSYMAGTYRTAYATAALFPRQAATATDIFSNTVSVIGYDAQFVTHYHDDQH